MTETANASLFSAYHFGKKKIKQEKPISSRGAACRYANILLLSSLPGAIMHVAPDITISIGSILRRDTE